MLQKAKTDLKRFYPTIDGKPTVAYLWARTVTFKNCRATIPLLKTRWLCKQENKRVHLTMEQNGDGTGVAFGIQSDVPVVGGNGSQKRENDKRAGSGTMSRSGALCPCCPAIMTTDDIRLEGRGGRLGSVMTAVVVDGSRGKEYRKTTTQDIDAASQAAAELDGVYADVPFGLPHEPIAGKDALGIRVPLYGLDRWSKLFTSRQLLALGTIVKWTQAARGAMECYEIDWVRAIGAYLSISLDRLADRSSALCRRDPTPTQSGIINTFSRFALPINWDFIEGVPLSGS